MGVCVFTSLTSISLTLRNMYTLHMLPYDDQVGRGGCINVLDEHFPYVTEHLAVVDMLQMLSDALFLDFLHEPILVPRVIPT